MSDHHKKTQEDQDALNSANNAARAKFAEMMATARDQAGFTLDGAAMATRISLPFIVALEKGAFAEMPGKVFARGFVRALCKSYGVSPVEYLQAFEEAHGHSPNGGERINVIREESSHTVRLRGEIARKAGIGEKLKIFSPSHYFRGLPLFGGVVLVGGVIALVYFLANSPEQAPPALVEVVQQPAVEAPLPVSVAVEPPASPTVPDLNSNAPGPAAAAAPLSEPAPVVLNAPVAAPVGPSIVPPPPAVPVPTPLTSTLLDPAPKFAGAEAGSQLLEFVAKSPVSIKIARDHAEWVTEELKADSYHLRFNKQVQLVILDAAAVEVSFNGKALGPLGAKGRARRLSFKASGVPLEANKI